jgi:hypothetical protein
VPEYNNAQTFADLKNFKLRNFTQSQSYTIFKKAQNLKNIFEMCTPIILEGQKTEWRKSGGRMLLGDNTGGEVISFLCAGVWISTGLPSIYTHT